MILNELNLIQYKLGIYKLEDLSIEIASKQLNKPETEYGIYLIKNKINNMLLIGEGLISGNGGRITGHIWELKANIHYNKKIQNDFNLYGESNFVIYGIIPESDEIKRKLIENKLQIYFGENCYNLPRRNYPTQRKLQEDNGYSNKNKFCGKIIDRINKYTKIQRVQNFDKCWETSYCKEEGYGRIVFKNCTYQHHILMYILHYGDICGITSCIDHLCNNKSCVNPNHLKLSSHKENIQRYFNSQKKEKINISYSSNFLGVSFEKKYKIYTSNIKLNGKKFYLGQYSNGEKAAQNRDYYVVKNNLLQKYTLNFHNIDYLDFTPHNDTKGKINKYLRILDDAQKKLGI